MSRVKLPNEIALQLYYSMLRIRMVQERIEAEYLEDRMKTPVHLYIGQEAIAVGVCAALERNDPISSNHRSHGHYLAKGGDLKELIAELHCKRDGCSGGFGGSMHLIDTRVGHLGSSSIVGGGIPIGTGLGLAGMLQRKGLVSVVFFGDGAADEGTLYESINFAMLKKLPVIYILENNQYSVCSPAVSRQACCNLFHRAPQKLLASACIDGNDVQAVYQEAVRAVQRARRGAGPSFIECRTYRMLGHAGCRSQDPAGYRCEEEIHSWRARCPLATWEQRLRDGGMVADERIERYREKIGNEIDQAFLFARQSPLPDAGNLERNLFSR
jgi:TPP-dependent pyruvate/acetoin dehydrogenase alpha subunit